VGRRRGSQGDHRDDEQAGVDDADLFAGLDPEEIEDLSPEVLQEARTPPPLQGRFRIHRQARDTMPFLIGLALAPMFAGLGAPLAGLAIGVVAVVGFIVRSRRRVAVFEIDAAGRISFARRGPIDWAAVESVTYRIRHQLFEAKMRESHRGPSTGVLRVHFRDRPYLKLAEGQLFQIAPTRRAVGLHLLSRTVKAEARSNGLVVKGRKGERDAWEARRPEPG